MPGGSGSVRHTLVGWVALRGVGAGAVALAALAALAALVSCNAKTAKIGMQEALRITFAKRSVFRDGGALAGRGKARPGVLLKSQLLSVSLICDSMARRGCLANSAVRAIKTQMSVY